MAFVRLRPVVKGALTFVPGMQRLLPESGGHTRSAAYCYGVWLKHLALLSASGLRAVPRTLAELGPGDSLGTGLAAMLSGADHYRALDVVEHSSIDANLRVFDELVELFRRRSRRPVKGWPDFDRHLDERLFPGRILSEEGLEASLAPARLAAIRDAIAHPGEKEGPVTIQYVAPWFDEGAIRRESIDLIISHAVLGEVVDLDKTYRALHTWLKPGGWMSHQIGFEFHGISGDWNGYWACPEPLWRVIKGRRPFVINRQPRSVHLGLLRRNNFDVVLALENRSDEGIRRSQLSAPWQGMSDDDFHCSGLFVQARK